MYLVSLGISLLNIASLALIFRFQRAEGEISSGSSPASHSPLPSHPVLIDRMIQVETNAETSNEDEKIDESDAISVRGLAKYKQLLSLPAVHIAALFIFTYVGVEVRSLRHLYID